MQIRNKMTILGVLTSVLLMTSLRAEIELTDFQKRAAVIRAKHEKLTADVLEVKEPARVTEADVFDDGGTVTVALSDATGKKFVACIDGRTQPQPGGWARHMWTGVKHPTKPGGKKVPMKGTEEAALHGVLLRWAKQQPGWEKVSRMSVHEGQKANRLLWEVHRFLVTLDVRFEEEKKGGE